MNQDLQFPPQGTPEYDAFMKSHFGDNYQFGFRAQFGIRFLAYLLDAILIFAIVSAIGYFLGYYQPIVEKGFMSFADPEIQKNIQKSLLPINIIMTFIYIAIEISLATSIGKMICGLKIGTQERTEAETSQLIIRTLLKHFAVLIMIYQLVNKEVPSSVEMILTKIMSVYGFLYIISCLFALRANRQTLHDQIAKTAVYKKTNILIESE